MSHSQELLKLINTIKARPLYLPLNFNLNLNISLNLLFFLFLLIFTSHNCFAEKSTSPDKNLDKNLDKIVAVVNDDIITNTDLNKKVSFIKNQLNSQSITLAPIEEIRKQVLNTMILESLQLQVARLNNISPTEGQINHALETVAQQYNTNILDLRKKLESQGIKYTEFKKDIINQLTLMSVQRAIASSEIKISQQEIEQEIGRLKNDNTKTSYKLSHILIAVPESPDSKQIQLAKERAIKVMQEIKNGKKTFSEIAMIASDAQQALNGGDLGWFNIAELPSLFADVVPKLSKQQVAGPIQDESGFHIIKLADLTNDSKKYQETQYKARHILIKKDEVTTDQIAQKELGKIKQDIKKLNNFSDMALIYSEDVGSASKGGELGWFSPYAMQPEFAQVVQSLKKGEISEPFQTVYGWHIVQLEDKKIVDNTQEWKKAQAKQIIENRKFNDALAMWQNKLKSESTIEVFI